MKKKSKSKANKYRRKRENAVKQRLDSLCLKQALRIATQQFKTDDPFNKARAKVLWQVAAKEIPRIHGQDGAKAIHFMEMMAYIGDDKFNTNYSTRLKLPSGVVYFHSPNLMQAIINANEGCEENLLKDLFLRHFYFSRDQNCSIWTFACKYKNLLQDHFSPDKVFQHSPMNVAEEKVFAKTLEKYEEPEVYGLIHEKTIHLKAFDMRLTLRFEDDDDDTSTSAGLELKWKKWANYRSSFEEFMKTRKFCESMDTEDCGYIFCDIAYHLFTLVKNPQPRPEYEELFLKEAFGFLELLAQFAKGRRWQLEPLILTALSYVEELGVIERIPILLQCWIFPIEDFECRGFQLSEREAEVLETCFNLALLPTTDISTRNLIMAEFLTISEYLCQNMIRPIKPKEYLEDQDPSWIWMEGLARNVLNYVKCLECLEQYNKVVQTTQESEVLRIKISKQWWNSDQDERDSALCYIAKIKAVFHRCKNWTVLRLGKDSSPDLQTQLKF